MDRTLAVDAARQALKHTLDTRPFSVRPSARLVEHLTLRDIKPSFKDNTNIVPTPPCKSAFSDREKAVERDVEVYRKEA
jgi:hypothetical protein